MSQFESAADIAAHRQVSATALLEGRADLRGYPYRHLGVLGSANDGAGVTSVLAAVELLTNYGWELVNISPFGRDRYVFAFLHRVSAGSIHPGS